MALFNGLLNKLENCESQTEFDEYFGESIFFTYSRIDRLEILLPKHKPSDLVTFENRLEYVELVKLSFEADTSQQLQSLRQGMVSIVPESVLTFLTGEELELLVCGSKNIDLDMLKRHTEYCPPLTIESSQVKFFWQALETFNQDDLRKFIKFAYAQESLPLTDAEFDMHPKIRMYIKPILTSAEINPDSLMPKSDTCFFNISIPNYSTLDIMINRLLIAINCSDMSGDM